MIDRLDATVAATPIAQQANRTDADVPSFHRWAIDNRSAAMQGGENSDDIAMMIERAPDESYGQTIPYDYLSTSLAISSNDASAGAVMEMDAIASSMIVGAGIDLPPQVIEIHALGEHGEAQIVALPWRLVSSGSLDQLIGSTAAAMGSRGSAEGATAYGVLAKSGSSGPASLSFSTLGYPEAPPPEQSVAAQSIPQHLLLAQADASHSQENQAGTAQGAFVAPSLMVAEWLTRWLRWTGVENGDKTLWLRDYRIADDEANRIVNDIRRFAQASNLQLERIVVNGHELWRSQNGINQQEVSSCR